MQRTVLLSLTLLSLICCYCEFVSAQPGKQFQVVQFRESRHEQAPAIDVRFSEPLSKDQDINSLVLLLSQDSRAPGEWLLSDDQQKLTFPFVSRNAQYELQFVGILRSEGGQTLSDTGEHKLKTRRLDPVASFTSRGFILVNGSKKGLPISVVNVDQIDVDFFRVDPDKINQFFRSQISAGKVNHYTLATLKNFSQLIHTSRFSLSPRPNQRTVTNIDMSRVSEIRDSGFYVAAMRPAGSFDRVSSVIYFTVSDIGMHIRRYVNHYGLHLRDIASGKVMKDVAISLYDYNGLRVAETRTDKSGEARLPVRPRASFIVANKRKQTTVLRIDRRALDLSEFNNATTIHSNLQAFSFAPRDIYRPGETAIIQVLLRDFDGQKQAGIPLGIELYRPDGQKILSTFLQPNYAGYYQLDYEIPQSAPTGLWKVRYRVGSAQLAQAYAFNVEEFHPQRLKLELPRGTDGKLLVQHEPIIHVPVKGSYLFGAAAKGNKVDGTARVSIDRHPFSQWRTFFFGQPREKVKLPRIALDDIQLDESGAGRLAITDRWQSLKSPLKVAMTVSVYETGGRPVTEKAVITIVDKRVQVGIDPLFEQRLDVGSTAEFNVLMLNGDRKPMVKAAVAITLVREDRRYYWSYANHRGWYWDFDAAPYTAWSGQVETDENGIAKVKLPLESGHYLLVAEHKSGARSEFEFETAGRYWGNLNQDAARPDAVLLGFDRQAYQADNTAKLSYVSPHKGHALLTLESNTGVLYKRSFELTEVAGELPIKIAPGWNRHDIFASLMVIQPPTNRDSVSPKRGFGLVHLPLKRAVFDIDLSVSVPAKVRPGQMVTARVQVAAPRQLKSKTFVTAALVDVGILNLTKFRTPRPESWFLAPRRYQVDLYDMYGDLIENRGLKSVRQKFGGGFGDQSEELTSGTTTDPARAE